MNENDKKAAQMIAAQTIATLIRDLDMAVSARVASATRKVSATATLDKAQKDVEAAQRECEVAYDTYAIAREKVESFCKAAKA